MGRGKIRKSAGGDYTTFNGKRYHKFSSHATKTLANKEKDWLKDRKNKARITKEKKRFVVWLR